jgi:hypothetical protein
VPEDIRIVVTGANGSVEENFTVPEYHFWHTAEGILTLKNQTNLLGMIDSMLSMILDGDSVIVPLSLEDNPPNIMFTLNNSL